MADLHAAWAWIVVLANGAVGLWALGAHWFAPLRRRALWWVLIAAEAALFVQVVIGVVMVSGQGYVTPRFHAFYGFVALFTVGLLYAYRNSLRSNLYLLYGLGSLFLMGLAIRAMLLHR